MEDLKRHWDAFGEADPLWAVLTYDSKKGNKWDVNEFMATGEAEVARWMEWFRELGLRPRLGRALDFGCGAGRLTRALASHYREVIGLDIAPSMIRIAQELNDRRGVRFLVNDRSDLAAFPADHFDLVYTVIVLQHIPPQHTRAYLREFARVLAPGGILAFQLPGERKSLPGDTFRGRLEVLEAPARVTEGRVGTLRARVHNASPHPWGEAEFIRLANHWLQDGELLVWDDGRAWLPQLAPGDSAEVSLDVTAPMRTGRLELQLDLVAEGVAWFAERGSPIERRDLEVLAAPGAGDAAPAEGREPEPEPRMEMNCIPRDEVVGLLGDIELRVVKADVSNTNSPWVDYSYVAVKPQAAGRLRGAARRWLPLGLRRSLKRLSRTG